MSINWCVSEGEGRLLMKEPAGMLIMGHALLLDGQNKGIAIVTQ